MSRHTSGEEEAAADAGRVSLLYEYNQTNKSVEDDKGKEQPFPWRWLRLSEWTMAHVIFGAG